jgi:hypothetical protein
MKPFVASSLRSMKRVTTELGNSIRFRFRIVPCHMPHPLSLAQGGAAEPCTGVTEIGGDACVFD